MSGLATEEDVRKFEQYIVEKLSEFQVLVGGTCWLCDYDARDQKHITNGLMEKCHPMYPFLTYKNTETMGKRILYSKRQAKLQRGRTSQKKNAIHRALHQANHGD
jgi:hypothetical protein